MRAGSLDKRIVLKRATMTTNAVNEAVPAWGDLASVAAEVTYRSSREAIDGQQVSATLTTRFIIRWAPELADLNPKDRVSYDGDEYDIHGVYGIGRHEGLEIHATARAD